jgi:DNA-binding XRE family transcriptional regulator
MAKRRALSPAGRKITGALRELIGELRTNGDLEGRLTVRSVRRIVPSAYGAKEVAALRKRLQASQAAFARYLGVSPKTVQSWEQGLKKPSPLARRFFDELKFQIDRDPGFFLRRMEAMAAGA